MAETAYIGVETEVPVYETNTINITADNISDYFTVTNGSYYFVGSDDTFTTNNGGVRHSMASTTLTALSDMDISFSYSYSSESGYDKFTLVVGGTTVANAVSGSTTTKTYVGAITVGQKILFEYAKDGSGDKNDDKCTFSNMVITTEVQTGTEIKSLAKKVKSCYIGGSNGIARKITKGYIGDRNGIARLFYTAHTHAYLSQSDYYFDDDINEDQHYYTKTCSCGDTITVWEDHGYSEYEEEATCTSDGFYVEYCPDCQKEFYYREYDATGHDWDRVIDTVEPTCTEQGYDIEQCRNCDATQNVNYVPELGHEEGEPVVVDSKAATCTEAGWSQEEYYCTRCGESLGTGGTREIPALGHAYKATKVFPTCTVDGYKTHTCLRCGHSYKETITAPGHVVDTVSRKCIVCGEDVPVHIESV